MIYRTSYGELGHCLNCFHNFDSDELWQQEIEYCPDCGEPLYTDDNSEHNIPEDTDFMEKKLFEYCLQFQAEIRKQHKKAYA
jgi:transcription initiation factor IIE alpha subunit